MEKSAETHMYENVTCLANLRPEKVKAMLIVVTFFETVQRNRRYDYRDE